MPTHHDRCTPACRIFSACTCLLTAILMCTNLGLRARHGSLTTALLPLLDRFQGSVRKTSMQKMRFFDFLCCDIFLFFFLHYRPFTFQPHAATHRNSNMTRKLTTGAAPVCLDGSEPLLLCGYLYKICRMMSKLFSRVAAVMYNRRRNTAGHVRLCTALIIATPQHIIKDFLLSGFNSRGRKNRSSILI